MGIVPLEWPDFQAWAEMTRTALHPEEARILRSLTITYVAQSSRSKEYDCPAPFLEQETSAVKSANIKQQMQRFKNRRSPR